MLSNSSIHRQELDADSAAAPAAAVQDSAGGAAQSRLSNTATEISPNTEHTSNKKPKTLHRFGLDWLIINFAKAGDSKFIGFLDSVFAHYDAESGFDQVRDIAWLGTNTTFPVVNFRVVKGDLVSYFRNDYDSILTIKKITPLTNLKGISKFNYRLTFYGTFFAFEEQNHWHLSEFLSVAIAETKSGILISQVACVHICADIENATTNWFDKGIKRLSKKLEKKISRNYQDDKTGLYETIYFGQKFKKKRKVLLQTDWFVRGYNKAKSIRDEGDEGLYPHYLPYDPLTRIEAVFNSAIFRKYKFALHQCLERDALFGLFATYLRSKDVHFKSVDFIEKELKKINVKPMILEKILKIPAQEGQKKMNLFEDEQKRNKLWRHIHRLAEDNRQTSEQLLLELLDELRSVRPSHIWS